MANTIGMFETGATKPGFHMTFTNGNTVSVQWGKYNYCDWDIREYGPGRLDTVGEPVHFSKNAEIAAWNSKNVWYRFIGDDVLGYQSPENVASFINFVSNPSCVLSKNRWVLGGGA